MILPPVILPNRSENITNGKKKNVSTIKIANAYKL
jgi:hypothetical protein